MQSSSSFLMYLYYFCSETRAYLTDVGRCRQGESMSIDVNSNFRHVCNVLAVHRGLRTDIRIHLSKLNKFHFSENQMLKYMYNNYNISIDSIPK